MASCPSCGRENPAGFEFCGFCRAPLAGDRQEIRKIVTVLFCDVTGSTALGERLDPEAVRGVMSRYFDSARTVLERHGGTVEKFIGDAVMAVFGVPVAHEDDALRAVRAGDELLRAVSELSGELERSLGARLEIRTGVNTGEVVAGDPSGGQSFVSGDPVNVAARLEQAAQPGEILIGEDTFRLVRDAVRVEAVEPLSMKGKGQPVPAFRLLEVLAGARAVARRLGSPMVGRDGELHRLRDAFDRAERDVSCELVTVFGEAGVGKSRLTLELVSGLANRARVLEGRCLPYGDGITFWPVAEMVRQAAGIDDGDSPGEALGKIGRMLEGRRDSDAALIGERLGSAIGLGGGSGAIQETFWAIRAAFEALAADRPLVAVFDDIHWAEPTLLDLIEYIAGFSHGHAVLLVCTARPELRQDRPDWGRAGAILELSPLATGDSERLMENLLGQAQLPAEVRGLIADTAEGNPLFVEEMLRMLIDDGVLRRDDGHWVSAGDISSVPAPRTIQALITARLDRLLDEERAVIQRASVVGQVFYWGAVSHLSPEGVRGGVGGHLQTLLRKELIEPEPSPFAGEDAFRFGHILVRDVAYDSMPKRTRVEMHQRFASWLGAVVGERVPEYEEIVAYHLEQAHRYLVELGSVDDRARRLAEDASGMLARSGTAALGRGDIPAGEKLLSRALALLDPDDPRRPTLLVDLSLALDAGGRLEEEAATLKEAASLARATRDAGTEARTEVRRMWLQLRLSSKTFVALLTEVHSMLPGLEEIGSDRALADAWALASHVSFYLGRCAEAESAMERSIHHARMAGDRRAELNGFGLFTSLLSNGPCPVDEALVRVPALLERAGGSKLTEMRASMNLALLYAMVGRIDDARASWTRAQDVCEELGERMFRATMCMYLGWSELTAGDPTRAEGPMLEAGATLERAGERGWLSTLDSVLGEVMWRQGKADDAERFARLAREAATPDDLITQMQWRATQAKVLADRGELRAAEILANQAVRAIDPTDYIKSRADARMALGYVLRAGGRRDEAAAATREALELYDRKGDVADAARARAEIEALAPE